MAHGTAVFWSFFKHSMVAFIRWGLIITWSTFFTDGNVCMRHRGTATLGASNQNNGSRMLWTGERRANAYRWRCIWVRLTINRIHQEAHVENPICSATWGFSFSSWFGHQDSSESIYCTCDWCTRTAVLLDANTRKYLLIVHDDLLVPDVYIRCMYECVRASQPAVAQKP